MSCAKQSDSNAADCQLANVDRKASVFGREVWRMLQVHRAQRGKGGGTQGQIDCGALLASAIGTAIGSIDALTCDTIKDQNVLGLNIDPTIGPLKTKGAKTKGRC